MDYSGIAIIGKEFILQELTTLCYIKGHDGLLMLHRIKEKDDINEGKWIGIGGHVEEGESPQDCVIREAFEESGLTLFNPTLRCFVTFQFEPEEGSDREPQTTHMFVYTCDTFEGDPFPECDEGVLAWVPEDRLEDLPMWEGDILFLKPLMMDAPFFSMKLTYHGDQLTAWELY